MLPIMKLVNCSRKLDADGEDELRWDACVKSVLCGVFVVSLSIWAVSKNFRPLQVWEGRTSWIFVTHTMMILMYMLYNAKSFCKTTLCNPKYVLQNMLICRGRWKYNLELSYIPCHDSHILKFAQGRCVPEDKLSASRALVGQIQSESSVWPRRTDFTNSVGQNGEWKLSSEIWYSEWCSSWLPERPRKDNK